MIDEIKKELEKRKINAKKDALAVYKCYTGIKLTKDNPKKAKMSAQILSRLWSPAIVSIIVVIVAIAVDTL